MIICVGLPRAASAQFPPEYGDSLTGTADRPAIRLPAPKRIKSKRIPDSVLENFIAKAAEKDKSEKVRKAAAQALGSWPGK